MNADLVKFILPAEFILARTVPTPAELAYGYQHGWLDDEGVILVAEAEMSARMTLPNAVEELALLLRDDRFRTAELISTAVEELAANDAPTGVAPSKVWLYLALDWVYEHRADFVEPLEVVELLYADFGYPAEIEGFVRFMPPPPEALVGHAAIAQRWKDYLSRMAQEHSARSSSR